MQTQRMIDRGARDAERQRLLGRDEWCRRFAIYIHGKTGVDNAIASQAANDAWTEEERERHENPAYGPTDPEDAAESELTYWDE